MVTIIDTNCSCTPTHPLTHTLYIYICVCLPWLPSLQCNDDWVSPLDWLHSCSAIPLSTVRNHLVSLGLLQSNWPFKEGIHYVKQCNWDWYSCCSIPHFVLHPSTLTHFSPFLVSPLAPPPLSRPAALGASLHFNIMFLLHLSSADSCWPLKAQYCSCPCYHFQHRTAPWLDGPNFIFNKKARWACGEMILLVMLCQQDLQWW